MLTKQATQEIIEVFYEEGVKLAMAEAGLIKVAKPKKQTRSKAVFGRMHDITAPREQAMHIKNPMKIQPSKMFKNIVKNKDFKTEEGQELMKDYFDTVDYEQSVDGLDSAFKSVTQLDLGVDNLNKSTREFAKKRAAKPKKSPKRSRFDKKFDKIKNRADATLKELDNNKNYTDALLKDTNAMVKSFLNRRKIK